MFVMSPVRANTSSLASSTRPQLHRQCFAAVRARFQSVAVFKFVQLFMLLHDVRNLVVDRFHVIIIVIITCSIDLILLLTPFLICINCSFFC